MIKKKTVKNSADPIFYMHGGHVWLWEEGALDNSWHATHIIPLSQSLSLSLNPWLIFHIPPAFQQD